VRLLEGVEAAEVCDARVGRLDLVGDTEDGRDLDERGGDDLAVEDGLAEVADGLRAQEAPPGGGRGGWRRRGRGRGHVRPSPRRRHPDGGGCSDQVAVLKGGISAMQHHRPKSKEKEKEDKRNEMRCAERAASRDGGELACLGGRGSGSGREP
jgi:hypothetical protein